jgi:hypothetical protein
MDKKSKNVPVKAAKEFAQKIDNIFLDSRQRWR